MALTRPNYTLLTSMYYSTTGSDRIFGPHRSGSRVSFDLSSGESDNAGDQASPSRPYYPFPMSSNTTFVRATGPYIPTVTKPPAEYRPDPEFSPTDMDDTYEPPSPIQSPRRTSRKRPNYSPTTPSLAELLAEETEYSQVEIMLMNSTPRKQSTSKHEVEEQYQDDDQPVARPIHPPTLHRSSSSSMSIGTSSSTLPPGSKVSHERVPTPIPTPLDGKAEFMAALSATTSSPSSTIATPGDQTPNVSPTRRGKVPMDVEDDCFDEIPEEEETEGGFEDRAENSKRESEGELANFKLGLKSAEADFERARGEEETYPSSSASTSTSSPAETRSPLTPFDSPEFRKINIREESGSGPGVQSGRTEREGSASRKGKEKERFVKQEYEDGGSTIGRVKGQKVRPRAEKNLGKVVDLEEEEGKKNA